MTNLILTAVGVFGQTIFIPHVCWSQLCWGLHFRGRSTDFTMLYITTKISPCCLQNYMKFSISGDAISWQWAIAIWYGSCRWKPYWWFRTLFVSALRKGFCVMIFLTSIWNFSVKVSSFSLFFWLWLKNSPIRAVSSLDWKAVIRCISPHVSLHMAFIPI